VTLRRFQNLLLIGVLALAGVSQTRANTAISVTGPLSYKVNGSTVTLAVANIENTTSGTTGTLRLELWAFPKDYGGQAESGYLLATDVLGTLSPNHEYSNVSETVPYTPPPNGTWVATMFVAEYTNASADSGYSPDVYVNFTNPLQVGPAAAAPSITSQPQSASVSVGSSATFSVGASGSTPLSYQWSFDGTPISGATASSYTVASAQIASAGNYTATVTNSAGSATSSAAVLTVTSSQPVGTARLINLSVRSNAGSGAQTLIGGFVIGGTGSKSVLVRADGPSLSEFGVSGELPDPQLGLFNATGTEIASNSKWGGSAALANIFAQVGAFALPSGSNDAALDQTLAPAAYTAQATSTSGDTGIVLVEVYDADSGTPSSRFINLSARSQVGTGSNTLIAGFVIGGSGTETVLIRGDGPGLSQFGVGGVLAAPLLTLYDSSGAAIATNQGWGNSSSKGSSTKQATITKATATTFGSVGAFSLSANSADCAMVATLPAGAYTAGVSGVNSTTGVALVEVYEIAQASGGGSPPVFTSQPVSQTITSGGSYTFIVAASGSLTYQWYLNGVAISGATGDSYAATQAGTYTVVASNANGSITSSPATVTVGGGGGSSGNLTGSWMGTWTEKNAGGNFCSYQNWTLAFTMNQSGNSVTGQFNMTIKNTSADGNSGDLCPDSDGEVDPDNIIEGQPGQLVQGTVSGSNFTIFTDSGIEFSGTITGNSISGTGDAGNGSGFSEGMFTITKQ
jgi:hypothetical protein